MLVRYSVCARIASKGDQNTAHGSKRTDRREGKNNLQSPISSLQSLTHPHPTIVTQPIQEWRGPLFVVGHEQIAHGPRAAHVEQPPLPVQKLTHFLLVHRRGFPRQVALF